MGCLRIAAALAAVFAAPAAPAQDWPDKPVRIVAPYAPGGSADTLGRLIAQKLSQRLKQNIVVENRPGAGGFAARKPSPRRAGRLHAGGVGDRFACHRAGGLRCPYDPVASFTHIALFGGPPIVLAVHPSLGTKDLQDSSQRNPRRRHALRLSGAGDAGAPHRRTVPRAERRTPGPCALQGRGARDSGPDRQPCAGGFRHLRHRTKPGPGGQSAGVGADCRAPHLRRAAGADLRRKRLRRTGGDDLVRPVRTRRHACGDREAPECCGARKPARARLARPVAGGRQRAERPRSRRLCRFHSRRDRRWTPLARAAK